MSDADTVFEGKVRHTGSLQLDGTAKAGLGGAMVQCAQVRVSYADLDAASTTDTVVIAALPANSIILGASYKLNTEFSGGSLSSFTMALGDGSDADRLIDETDVFTGASTAYTRNNPADPGGAADVFPLAVATGFDLTLTFVGSANVNTATAGEVDVYVWYFAPGDPRA